MSINSFKELHRFIHADAYRYIGEGCNFLKTGKLYFLVLGFRYLVWFRVCAYLQTRLFFRPLWLFSFLRLQHLSHKSGIQIPYSTQIGPGLYLGHFGSIVINGAAIIGKNVNVSTGVVIGQANRGNMKGTPIIGDEVYIAPGAKIIGAVRIGNNVAIGANAVVTKDVPDNAVVAGIPAKIISMDGANGYINRTVSF